MSAFIILKEGNQIHANHFTTKEGVGIYPLPDKSLMLVYNDYIKFSGEYFAFYEGESEVKKESPFVAITEKENGYLVETTEGLYFITFVDV